LRADDLVIEYDGTPQTVHLDEQPESRPFSLAVVIQVGRRADYELPRIQGLGAMLAPLMESGLVSVAVLTFDSEVHPLQNFTTNSDALQKTLKQLMPGDGGAAVLDALKAGATLLNGLPRDRQKELLLISENRDHGSHETKIEDVLTSLGTSNTVVYSLAFSPSKSNVLDTMRGKNNPDLHPEQTEVHEGPDLLAPLVLAAQAMRKNTAKTIATMNGGEYVEFKSGKFFYSNITDFSNHLHRRYLLSFAPSKPHPGLHRLTVSLRQPGKAIVLARNSYWAAGQQ
jgi:hypothetical protein